MGKETRSVRNTKKVKLWSADIKKIEGLEKASFFIESIILVNNKIETIEGLNKCKNLVKL